MSSPHVPRVGGALLGALLVPACGESTVEAGPPPPVVYAYELANAPESRIEFAVDRSLEHALDRDPLRVSVRVSGADPSVHRVGVPPLVVEGRRLELEDDELLLDGASLGAVLPPARISVEPGGVSVDGVLRAPF